MLNELRKKIVLAAYQAKEGHIPSALSILDILYVLHDAVLGPNDRFILSKGHGSLALYATLGLLDGHDQFAAYSSSLGGHPDRNKIEQVVASTGSLGHGIGQAVGIALAHKINHPSTSWRVFCLVGDGECEEGSVWEAFNLSERLKLSNLTVIVDFNGSNDSYHGLINLREKLTAFGFLCLEINGHDYDDIRAALKYIRTDKPIAVIAKTIKGKGIARMENNPEWHHRVPTESQLVEILNELNA